MARVLLVAFEGVQTLDVTGPAEVFAAAARYHVELLSAGGGTVTTTSGIALHARDLSGVRVQPTDTVLVAGGNEDAIRRALEQPALLDFLRRAARVAARIGSVCSGAFLLASIGVLDGHAAATHWSACERLARAFPAIRVDPNAIFVREGRLWTSAGVTTGIDMALAMVEEDAGRVVADAIASRLVLYLRRPGFQSQFSEALLAQTERADPLAAAVGRLAFSFFSQASTFSGVSSDRRMPTNPAKGCGVGRSGFAMRRPGEDRAGDGLATGS